MAMQRIKDIGQKWMLPFGLELFGSLLVAIGVYNFAVNAGFPMTGFTGLALIAYRLRGLPIGVTTIILNLPVAILCCGF